MENKEEKFVQVFIKAALCLRVYILFTCHCYDLFRSMSNIFGTAYIFNFMEHSVFTSQAFAFYDSAIVVVIIDCFLLTRPTQVCKYRM